MIATAPRVPTAIANVACQGGWQRADGATIAGSNLSESSFYAWRCRLRSGKWKPARRQKKRAAVLALVERSTAPAAMPRRTETTSLELLLPAGERLRIGGGVDLVTLRTVLAVLRA